MDDRIELLTMNYLNGTLTEQESIEWKQLVDAGTVDIKEVEAYKKMMKEMDSFDRVEPSDEMSTRFYAGLEDEIIKIKKITFLDRLAQFFQEVGLSRSSLQLAYTLVLLILGLGAGFLFTGKPDKSEIAELSVQVQEMKSIMMLSMLEKESPTERIKAVSLTQEMSNVDGEIIDALFKTLNNDSNTNVRLEALDALLRYSDRSNVRIGLIESLRKQENPLVQLALADVMVLLQDPDAKDVLEELLEKEDVMEDVKEVISERLNTIKS